MSPADYMVLTGDVLMAVAPFISLFVIFERRRNRVKRPAHPDVAGVTLRWADVADELVMDLGEPKRLELNERNRRMFAKGINRG